MKAEQHGPLPPDEEKRTQIALFRYGLIAPLLNRPLERGEINAHLIACAAKTHQIPFSRRTTVNAETIWRYYARFRKGGFESLKPQLRSDADKPRRIPEYVVQKAIALREALPSRSAKTIVEILHRDVDIPADLKLVPHTLSLILNKRGKSREQLVGQSKAFRRFEREHANDMWQGDMLVGPYLPDVERPGKYRRTALFCFIDDYSRLVPYGEFFNEESLPRLERVFKVAILRRGLPSRIFVDNGKVYVSTQLAAVCATLGIRQIHSTPYTPNTRGKIERFFGTVRSQFLSEVEAGKIATLEELNNSFQAWVEMIYHRRAHSETEQTPLQRFQESIAAVGVRQADPVQLRQAFLWREKRKITRTATISLQGNRYGVDPYLAGRQVELRFDPFDLAEVEVWENGHFLGNAQVQKLERDRHLSLDRIPSPKAEAQQEHVDFLAALRAEHQAQLAQELGSINFAQVIHPDPEKAQAEESTNEQSEGAGDVQ